MADAAATDAAGDIGPLTSRSDPAPRDTVRGASLAAAIFDVDGVLLASPHEQAWRDALSGFADSAGFTTAVYQAEVAGKPRRAGAVAALRALGVADVDRQAPLYAAAKQERLEELVRSGAVAGFPDALRFVQAIAALGWPMAVASSSANANAMLRPIRLPGGKPLLELFSANLCGRTFREGKPNPAIFLAAAFGLRTPPVRCLVIEDAPAGIVAARAGDMAALGIARLADEALLAAAGADLVVDSLDEVDLASLAAGGLRGRSA